MEVLAGLVPSEAGGGSGPNPSPGLVDGRLHVPMLWLPSLCSCVQISPFYKGISHVESEPTPVTRF